ncbi:kinase suppressor of Ras 2 [Planococcus citri]|uniref:kinase suppressor of Ras 2 n=1 Tax=Planococcus citri TaxID=170843 RepID=UPI0031F7F861
MAEEDQDVLQPMIDTFADRLVGLRTQCSTSVELTQREIRTLEGKLIKLFSRQLVMKAKFHDKLNTLPPHLKNVPKLEQWLQVVGLCPNSIQNICSKVKTVEALLEKPQCKLRNLLCNCSQLDEEFRRLSTALRNLKRYTEILLENDYEGNNLTNEDAQLHWDSWDWQSNSRTFADQSLPSSYASSVTAQDYPAIHFNGNTSAYTDQPGTATSGSSGTPPVLSPPHTPMHKIRQDDYVQKSPGSMSDHARYAQIHVRYNANDDVNDSVQPISKSRSHESQLYNLSGVRNVNNNFTFAGENTGEVVRNGGRTRLPTVPGGTEHGSPSTSLYSSPTRSPPFIVSTVVSSMNNSLLTVTSDSSPIRSADLGPTGADPTINGNGIPAVPRSPRTPTSVSRVMAHDIAHRFTKHFSFNRPCDYCCKPIVMNTGLRCKECRYRCHKDCESKVPPSCGLPKELVKEFINWITPPDDNAHKYFFPDHPSSSVPSNGMDSSPIPGRHTTAGHPSPAINGFLSNIERRVKAVVNISSNFLGGSDSTVSSNSHSSAPSSPALFITNQPAPATASAILNKKPLFDFSLDDIKQEAELNSTALSQDDSISSETNNVIYEKCGVNREDSQDSQNWDGECTDKVWPRQLSVSMKEWEIPWNELKMGDKLGTGHFGTVYSGYWHGDVAIKVLNMDYLGDEKMLETFKYEVSTFRKTRHDNLVLFMGACMKPPRLAIVTSMVHGNTLYKYIHLRRDKFSMGKTTIIAQQISQGMGYLHAKGIVHKDLRTKNIFLEKERVIITDFGLFSVTKLCFKNRTQDGLIIPPGWLCYLAPEIMRSLRVHVKPDDEQLPFSKASDVYAFGTVWYELLCGEWPYTTQDPEAVIWQVGKGMKPSLANLEASRDVKDILMQCWAYQSHRRPDFTSLLKTLDKLPKKKLARSPSHPVHLSRSAESMF